MPQRTPYQQTLTQADVDALCAVAKKTWRAGSGRRRQVFFRWRGKRLLVTHTALRLCIHEADGTPVAYCYD